MKKPLKIAIPVVAVAALGFGGYTFAFAGEEPPKPKVHGDVYVLGKEFVLNLADGRYAKMTVAIVKEPSHEEGGHSSGSTPPEGFGDEPQEALVRGIVTDVVSGRPAARLVSPAGRRKLQRAILERLEHDTDVHATRVVFTDVTVQ